MKASGMKDLEILQFDIQKAFWHVRKSRPDFDIAEYEETYRFVTDVDTNELRVEPEAIEAAEKLLDDLLWIKNEGTDPQ